MQPDRPFWGLIKRDVQIPFVVELEVLDGHEPEPDLGKLQARSVHESHFLAPGVQRVPVREGRVRASSCRQVRHLLSSLVPYASGAGPVGPGPFPGIVNLFGVGGGLLEYRASLLAGKGFVVMALAYYNYDDLPEDIDIIHLEYFEEAVNYLLSHPQIKGSGIGLLGTSKAGELCISMASFLKGITGAVIINGSIANVSLHSLVGGPGIWGGEPRAHAMAQVDAWKRLQTNFHKHLGVKEGTIPAKL
ncbi:Acyl-coenzyme A thioesterase 5 [Heterocephalus glaber]|uniref:Acyl-coenzyme A thioesterase 5 n=1 Tax=Heterocephalus glaber TaxID=10181 RepID=G5C1P2_HETGA|nr:Acyl-coenzyme A thioesterase 5 [Heterocephalus glaber]